MAIQDKSKEDLIAELQQLQQENISLRTSFAKEIAEYRLSNDYLRTKMINCDAVFESSPVPMFIVDETTNIVMVNLAAVKLCGGSEEEILQHRPGNALRCIHSSKDPRGCGYAPDCKICEVRNGIESLIAKGGHINGAQLKFILKKDGTPQDVWMNVGVEPLIKDVQKLWCIAMNDITEQKKTEYKLKESQTLLNSIIDSTNDMIWSVDAEQFGLLQWNTSFYDYFLNDRGIEIGIGMTPKDLFPAGSEFILFWENLFKVTLKHGSYSKEYETFSQTRILQINLELLIQNGKTFGISVFAKNITAQKKAEIGLRESQAQLKSIIDSTSEMIWSVDIKNFGLLTFNQSFVDFFLRGLGVQIIKGMRPEEMLPRPDLVDYWYGLYHKALESKSIEDYYQMATSNRILKININRLMHGDVLAGLSVFAKDVTAQKQAEEKLKESQTLLKSIINNTSDMIWAVDFENLGLISWNQTFEDYFLLNRQIQIKVGTHYTELFPSRSEYIQMWSDLYERAKTTDSFSIDYQLYGSSSELIITFNLLYHEGKPFGISAFGKDITERKRAEEKIRLSEEKFRAAFMTIKDGFYIGTLKEGIIIEVNSGFEDIFQYTPEESIGKTSLELGLWAVPEDRAFMVSQLKEKGFCNNLETMGRKKNGELFHVSITTSVLNIDQVPHIVGVIRDIKERKLAEEEIIRAKHKAEQSEEKFRSMFTSMQEGVYLHEMIYDDKGKAINYRIIEANPVSEKYLNIKKEDAIGKLATELFGTAEAPFLDIYSQVSETGQPVSFEQYFEPMGKHFFISTFSPKKGEFATVFLDITESKNHEIELIAAKEKAEESEYRLKLATASGQLGIWDWNLVENTMVWDDRMFELYGITQDTFPNNVDAWINGLHPDDKQKAIDACNAALTGELDFNTSFRVLHPDGKTLHLKADGSIIRDADGKPLRMIGINKDITEAKLAEEQIMTAKEKAEESDRLKSVFLANMSHEIRTPLNSIIGFSELLNDPDFDEKQKNEFTKAVIENGNNLLVIISDIMDLSMLEARQIKIKKEQFRVKKLLHDLENDFRKKANNKALKFQINAPIDSEEMIIESDFYRIKQIFNNLIGNALKFTHTGFIEIGFSHVEGIFEFFVKDTGIGIASEFYEDIFERFRQVDESRTRKYGGNGLGLAISKNLVEVLGGRIRLESEVGKGSTFYFTIPANIKR